MATFSFAAGERGETASRDAAGFRVVIVRCVDRRDPDELRLTAMGFCRRLSSDLARPGPAGAEKIRRKLENVPRSGVRSLRGLPTQPRRMMRRGLRNSTDIALAGSLRP